MSAAWRLHLRAYFQNAVSWIRQRLGWHVLALIVVVLCVTLIVLELIPARTFVRTTFTATIYTQEMRLRLGERQATLTGVSGSRILARELDPAGGKADTGVFDLTDRSSQSLSAASDLELIADAPGSYLELDRLWLPPRAAVKISGSGEDSALAIEFIEPGDAGKVDARFVWRGGVRTSDGNDMASGVGARIWEASQPSLTIDKARINGLIPTPAVLSAVAFDRVVSGDGYQSPASAIIGGELQFDIAGFPGRPLTIREGEMLSFGALDAQMLNLSLSDRGLRFLLIGSADTVSLGFLANDRDVQPSMLDAILARQSLTILGSALFAMLLGVMSAINFGVRK